MSEKQLIKSYGDYIGIITSSGKECLIDNNMIDKLMGRNVSFS